MTTLPRLIAAMLLVLCAAHSPLMAQPFCPSGDDGFNVGCCVTPQPQIPQFPSMQLGGKWGCLHFCNLEAEFPVNVSFSAPAFVLCDLAIITVTVTPTGVGSPGWTGTLFAKYSRTWLESPVPGIVPNQRWRFLVNGDLLPVPNAAGVISAPCPYPVSVLGAAGGPLKPLHMSGNIDYICDQFGTSANPWSIRASLHHFEECIQHGVWTGRPLPVGTNPDRTYHLVAPSSFTFAPVPVPMGPINAEAVRSAVLNWPPVPGVTLYECKGEAHVVQGSLQDQFQDCLCSTPSPIFVPRWHHQDLVGTTTCAGVTNTFASIPLPGTFLPTGFAALEIGFWAGGTFTPIIENLTAYFGVLGYTDACTTYPIHIVTGVATSGIPSQLFTPASPIPTFVNSVIDLQNARRILGNNVAPTFGIPFIATTVWNLDTP